MFVVGGGRFFFSNRFFRDSPSACSILWFTRRTISCCCCCCCGCGFVVVLGVLELGLAPERLFSLFGVLCAKEKDEEEEDEGGGGGGNKGEVDPLPSTSFPAITIHFPATAHTTPGRRAPKKHTLIFFCVQFSFVKKGTSRTELCKRPKRPGGVLFKNQIRLVPAPRPGEREARGVGDRKNGRGTPAQGSRAAGEEGEP